ncbi:MAG TPA: hypothetical protein VFC44_16915 [Candidatus Saccharimonadales bacterium]|nr:hypothetical protein [Candidatus Saccharimonadales bacterium]
MSNPPPIIKPVTLVFVGPMQNPAVKNLRSACCNAVSSGTKEIQILFSSGGGAVDEAFALYTFLRALPLKLTMHAIGNVDSSALNGVPRGRTAVLFAIFYFPIPRFYLGH